MKLDTTSYRLTDKGRAGTITLVIGIVGLLASGAGWFVDSARFHHAYLTAFVFWLSLALGGLFFTMLHILTASRWSVVLRRISEHLAMQLPWMVIAFIPVALGMHDLYHWSHEDVVATDHLLQGKAGYLNTSFFLVRAVAYFVLWSLVALMLRKHSLNQDRQPDRDHIAPLRRWSAIGMLLFAATVTLASFDWLMSLQPHWYSTIYGVYFFGGLFLAGVSLLAVICWFLQRGGVLTNEITVEHYHDLGKLMFAFVIFWAYIGFSQYFLIWYGNIPEETFWFLSRWEGGWKPVSLVLLFGHFALPFVFLIFRNVKRKIVLLGSAAIWILVMHWVDMYWLVYPSYQDQFEGIGWIELAPMVGLGGIFCWLFWRRVASQPLIPVNDPWLKESIGSQSR
jgi:hypothetical protein